MSICSVCGDASAAAASVGRGMNDEITYEMNK